MVWTLRLARHGGLSYLEIPAVDPRRSAAFYAAVLGWNVRGQDSDDPRFEDGERGQEPFLTSSAKRGKGVRNHS